MAHSPATTAAWNALLLAAKADQTDQTYARRLWERAEILAHTLPAPSIRQTGADRQEVKGTNGNTLRSGHVAPIGRSKGTPIEELDTKDLGWLLAKAEADGVDPAKQRWHEKDRPYLEALRAEMAIR